MSKKRSKPTAGKKLTAGQLKKEIFRHFKKYPKKWLNAKQVIKRLKIENNKDSVQYAMESLVQEDKLFPLADQKFRLDRNYANGQGGQSDSKTYEGFVDMTRSGAAFIVVSELEQDVYISAKRMNSALHGDRVQISLRGKPKGRRPEGEVKKVLERATDHFLGTLHLSRKYGVVIPDKLNMPMDIMVPLDDLNEAKDRDKVVVKIVKWPTRHNHSPVGKITTVLGEVGSSDIEMQAILLSNGFNLGFNEETLAEAEAYSDEIPATEIHRRRDMREVTTFTIDPVDAKDFDDALSIRLLDSGEYEIGIHIADVTHFVKPKTMLDQEAYQRSTSVYLVDRVLPMLPERLSNGLCSLRPNEDKFTFSAVFTFNKQGKVSTRWFGKTLIHSDRRFAYEEAQEVLDSGEGDFAKELKKLNEIAKKLRKEKFKNGAIAFEAEEVRFKLDEEGNPIDVYVKERKDAHKLIEDFMLLANREVATYISKKGEGKEIPFVYRVHDAPDPDKLADFALFAKNLGFKMEMQTPKQVAASFNKLAKAAREDEALRMLEPIAIRSMAKAVYTTENIGHYGLGFDNYSHFTSPIRRYADVLVHRLLERNLGGTYYAKKEALEEQCKHISAQERKAQEAERESIKYKQVEFIKKHVGEVFEGHIAGFHERGFFVQLSESHCEGMVPFDSLDERFSVSDGRLSAKGRDSGTVLRMGELLLVKIVSADLAKRQIEMEWVDEDE